ACASVGLRGDRRVQGALQQTKRLLAGDCLSKQVPLSLGTPACLEARKLPGIFNAFGRRRQAEAARKPEDRLDDHLAFMVGVEAIDETAIDLDLVEMQLLQLSERRITGAEIIESDAHPRVPQLIDHLPRHLEIIHERALGDLKLEPTRIESAVREDVQNAQPQ